MTYQRFEERVNSQGRVDSEAGIIRGAKLLGRHSRNGREYTERAMQNAVELYRGKKVYLNHPEPAKLGEDRNFHDWVGVIENPRYTDGAIYGDVRLRKQSPHFSGLIEAATEFNGSIGMSHVADGESRLDRATGLEVIDTISDVLSVDIVMDAATCAGLFESHYTGTMQTEIDQLLSDARELKKLATPKIRYAFEQSDVSLVTGLNDRVRGLSLTLGNWIASENSGVENSQLVQEDARQLFKGIESVLADPLAPNTPTYAAELFDELIAMVERLSKGEEIELEPITPEEIQESFKRYR